MSPTTPAVLPLLRRLDPRTKILALIVLAVQAFVFRPAASLLPEALLLAAAALAAGISVRVIAGRLRSVAVFAACAVTVNMFTVSGRVFYEFSGIYVTREGMVEGFLLSGRIILLALGTAVLVKTTAIVEVADAVEAALHRAGRRWAPIMQVLTIALNFVPLLIQSARQIKNAHIVRGADPDRNLVRQLRFAATATVPLFAATLRSSEHLALAMESRCYDPGRVRTHFVRLRWAQPDGLVLSFVIAQFLLSTLLASTA